MEVSQVASFEELLARDSYVIGYRMPQFESADIFTWRILHQALPKQEKCHAGHGEIPRGPQPQLLASGPVRTSKDTS